MSLIGRWECPEHGGDLGDEREAGPDAWCPQHGWTKAEWVEYVRADLHRGAVEALERLADPGSNVWDRYTQPHRHTVRFARNALDRLGGQ